MEQLIKSIKNITPQQWLNIIFAMVFLFGYQNYTERIKRLEENIEQCNKARDAVFQMYLDCNNSNK